MYCLQFSRAFQSIWNLSRSWKCFIVADTVYGKKKQKKPLYVIPASRYDISHWKSHQHLACAYKSDSTLLPNTFKSCYLCLSAYKVSYFNLELQIMHQNYNYNLLLRCYTANMKWLTITSVHCRLNCLTCSLISWPHAVFITQA